MKRALIRLYPKPWRDRYGEEIDALLQDASAGWRGNFDVVKGALGMRLKYHSGRGIMLAFVLAGALTGFLASYCVRTEWRATAVMQITPARIHESSSATDAARVAEALRRIVTLRPEPRDTRITVRPTPNSKNRALVFSIAAFHPDPAQAKFQVGALVARFLQANSASGEYFLDILDPPYIPKRPIYPNRAAFAGTGTIAGLIFGMLTLLIRRRGNPRGLASA